ncbi:MAG: hypothetical protein AB7O24_04290 [Kofleriaceae bacterium]
MAMTKDAAIVSRSTGPHIMPGPVKEAALIYLGATLAVDTTDGTRVPASASATKRVIGVADQHVDNSDGVDGDLKCGAQTGVFLRKNDATHPVRQQEVGQICYVKDDETVMRNSGGVDCPCGVVHAVTTEGVWVEIDPANLAFMDAGEGT